MGVDMMVGTRFFIFSFLPILVLLLLVALVVFFTRRTLANGTAALSPRRLVEGYIFTVLLVTMILTSTGLADLARPSIAHYFGIASSYRPEPVYDPNRKQGEEPKYDYDARAPRRDFLSGAAELSIGLVVGILHLMGLRRLGRAEPFSLSPVYRLFLIVGLVIYTSAVLLYAVGSVKDLLIYRYAPPPINPQTWFERPIPGDQIAGMIGFLPLWVLMVARLFRYAKPGPVAG